MPSSGSMNQELVAEITKTIVREVAPEEIDLVDELLHDYFANPAPPDRTGRPVDDPLGWGAGEAMVDATTAAAAMVSASLGFIADSTHDRSGGQLRHYLTARQQDPSTRPLLSSDLLSALRQVALSTARQYGMDAERAEAMANAMLVTLMLGENPNGAAGSQKPIKILFLAVNPKGTLPLRLDEEIRNIDEALRKSDFRHRFQIEQQWAVRVSDLQGLLLRHAPDIVHFSGHGSSGLILEDMDGQPREVPPAALADLFGILNDTVRCVVLNACYSHEQAMAISPYVDAVIGMTDEIDDETSVAFATAFYQALGYGKDVPTAFKLGVSQLRIYDLPSAFMPQLLVK